MTDLFAVLELEPAPWLDGETIKDRFLQLSAVRHPDAGGSVAEFAQLNAAWQTLRDPASRLRHFLELKHPEALELASKTPADLGDLFMQIASARQSTQQLTGKLSGATSPLTRSLLEGDRRALLKKLEILQAEVKSRQDLAQAAVHGGEIDASKWGAILAHLVYLGRWSGQLQESVLSLS